CAAHGAHFLCIQTFDQGLSEQSPEAFFRWFAPPRGRVAGIVVGDNFCYGRNREGDASDLARRCAAEGIAFSAVSAITRGGATVSTSRIRHLLQSAGDASQAAELLG